MLVPVLPYLGDYVRRVLPDLLKLNEDDLRIALLRIITAQPPPIPLGELLMHLHLTRLEYLHLKKLATATQICLSRPIEFNQQVLGAVLQRLADTNPLPKLFMRTLIHAVHQHPTLKPRAMNLLRHHVLPKGRLWKDEVLWLGFIRFCERHLPESVSVVFDLPVDRCRQVFEKSATIRDQVSRFPAGYVPRHVYAALEEAKKRLES